MLTYFNKFLNSLTILASSLLLSACVATNDPTQNLNATPSSNVAVGTLLLQGNSFDKSSVDTIPTNAFLQAWFSDELEPSSVNSNSFFVTLKNSKTKIPGKLSPKGTNVTFSPINSWSSNTTYTVSLTVDIADLDGDVLSAPESIDFTTGSEGDFTAPTITSTDPVDLAVDPTPVPIDTVLTVIFNEAMDSSTINSSTFALREADTAIRLSGQVSSGGSTATFVPDVPGLANAKKYTATISKDVKDVAGNSLGTDFSWSFFSEADKIAPTVLAVSPLGNVQTNATVTVNFSEPILSKASVLLVTDVNGAAVRGAITPNVAATAYTFVPNVLIDPLRSPLTVSLSSSITDLALNSLDLAGSAVAVPWTFTVSAGLDQVAPAVTFSAPPVGIPAPIGVVIVADFSKPIIPNTLDGNFTLRADGAGFVLGTVVPNFDNTQATFTPSAALDFNTPYTATINSNVLGQNNVPVVQTTVSFTTQADTTQPIIVLPTVPSNGDIDVPVDSTLQVTFSKPMALSSFNLGTTFKVSPSVGSNNNFTSTGNNVVTYTPDIPFDVNLTYVVELTTGLTDQVQPIPNNLLSGLIFSFSTPVPLLPPEVVSKSPDSNETVAVDITGVRVTFSKDINTPLPSDLSIASTGLVLASGGCDGDVAAVVIPNIVNVSQLAVRTYEFVFSTAVSLSAGACYQATLGTGITDTDNLALALTQWNFFTAAAVTTTPPPPEVLLVDPDGSTAIPITATTITVTFSKDMDLSSFNPGFSLTPLSGTTLTPSVINVASPTALSIVEFTVDSLTSDSSYLAKVAAGVVDTKGVLLQAPFEWTFSTEAASSGGHMGRGR